MTDVEGKLYEDFLQADGSPGRAARWPFGLGRKEAPGRIKIKGTAGWGMVFVNGKIPSFEMDDDYGYPYDSGNHYRKSMFFSHPVETTWSCGSTHLRASSSS